MKLAYLILAHQNPAFLRRLVQKIQHPCASIFLHIDKKSPIGPFRESLEGLDVTFLENRTKVYWGGFGALIGTMELIDVSLGDAKNFTHFFLLSNSDYPIKPNQHILNYLSSENNNFIDITENLSMQSQPNAINRFHFKGVPWLNPKISVDNFVDRVLTFILNRAIWATRLDKRVRVASPDFEFYRGSTWWCLKREALEYVRDFCRENPRIYKYNRFVHAPDEVLIPSIMMNSNFDDLHFDKEQVDISPKSFSSPDNVFGVHYIDWRNGGSHPRTLTENDFGNLRDSSALFARKFDPDTSAMLLDMIDERLL